jgi:hypothetical protein
MRRLLSNRNRVLNHPKTWLIVNLTSPKVPEKESPLASAQHNERFEEVQGAVRHWQVAKNENSPFRAGTRV